MSAKNDFVSRLQEVFRLRTGKIPFLKKTVRGVRNF